MKKYFNVDKNTVIEKMYLIGEPIQMGEKWSYLGYFPYNSSISLLEGNIQFNWFLASSCPTTTKMLLNMLSYWL